MNKKQSRPRSQSLEGWRSSSARSEEALIAVLFLPRCPVMIATIMIIARETMPT